MADAPEVGVEEDEAEGLPLDDAEGLAVAEEEELVGSLRDVSGAEDGDSVASMLTSDEAVGSGADPLNALHPVSSKVPPIRLPSRTFFIFHPFTRTMIDQTVADVTPGERDYFAVAQHTLNE